MSISEAESPIIIIEDDLDDQDILQQVLDESGIRNKIRFFGMCHDVIPYLTTTRIAHYLYFAMLTSLE
jgi:hypothetical protein